jgi:hypothetical protein
VFEQLQPPPPLPEAAGVKVMPGLAHETSQRAAANDEQRHRHVEQRRDDHVQRV